MADIHFDIDDSEFQNLLGKVEQAIPLTLKHTATDVWANIRKESPTDHGRLAGSFALEGGDLTYHIKSAVEYAFTVYSGSGKRGDTSKGASGKVIDIYPVSKKALYWPGADHPVRHVRHPGIPSNDYIDRAFDTTTRRIGDFVKKAMRELGIN